PRHQCAGLPELAPVRPGGRLRFLARRQAGDLRERPLGHARLPAVRPGGRATRPDLGRTLEDDGFRPHRIADARCHAALAALHGRATLAPSQVLPGKPVRAFPALQPTILLPTWHESGSY